MKKLLFCCVALAFAWTGQAQQFAYKPFLQAEDPAAPSRMRQLAQQVLEVYKSPNPSSYLDNLFRLQLLAGQYTATAATMDKLSRVEENKPLEKSAIGFPYQLYNELLAMGPLGQQEASIQAVLQKKYHAYNDENKLWVVQYYTSNDAGELKKRLEKLLVDNQKKTV